MGTGFSARSAFAVTGRSAASCCSSIFRKKYSPCNAALSTNTHDNMEKRYSKSAQRKPEHKHKAAYRLPLYCGREARSDSSCTIHRRLCNAVQRPTTRAKNRAPILWAVATPIQSLDGYRDWLGIEEPFLNTRRSSDVCTVVRERGNLGSLLTASFPDGMFQ